MTTKSPEAMSEQEFDEYIAELKTHFSNSMSDKSRTIKFIISTAVE